MSRWFEHNWYFRLGGANVSNLQLYRDIDRLDENPIQTPELVHLNGQTLALKPGASKHKIYFTASINGPRPTLGPVDP